VVPRRTIWTADEYHETDLDLCAPFGATEQRVMRKLGFRRDGRHWERRGLAVAVEFPESRLAGDINRTRLHNVGEGAARIIGIDDLYLDRLRQATHKDHVEGVEFHSALAVAAAGYGVIDWAYVEECIAQEAETSMALAGSMRRLDRKLRRRVRASLGPN
jgi:hypothetical protein